MSIVMATIEPSKLQRVGNWLSTLFIGDLREQFSQVRESVARIDERTLHMQRDIDEMKPKVNEMYPKVLDMYPKVQEMFPKLNVLWEQASGQHRSPLQPNEEGRYIIAKSGIHELVDAHLDALIVAIERQKPATAYDAQTAAKVAMSLLKKNSSLERTLKDRAYQAGSDVDMMLFVGSMHLRDLYLARHPELAPAN